MKNPVAASALIKKFLMICSIGASSLLAETRYVTLSTDGNQLVPLTPTDVVEIVGATGSSGSGPEAVLLFATGESVGVPFNRDANVLKRPSYIFTGLNSVRLNLTMSGAITMKITTDEEGFITLTRNNAGVDVKDTDIVEIVGASGTYQSGPSAQLSFSGAGIHGINWGSQSSDSPLKPPFYIFTGLDFIRLYEKQGGAFTVKITPQGEPVTPTEKVVSFEERLATTEAVTATNVNAIAGNGTNIQNNAAGIATNVTAIAGNGTSIQENAAGIEANAAGIQANTTGIEANTTGIEANTTGMEANTTGIQANAAGITGNGKALETVGSVAQDNATGIARSADAIAGNASSIQDIATSMETMGTSIQDNATGIATNVTAIAGNETSIQGNATGIATNVTAIAGNGTTIEANSELIREINLALQASEIERGRIALEIAKLELSLQTLDNQISLLGSNAAFLAELGEEFATKEDLTTAISEGKTQGINAVTSDPNNWNVFTADQIQEMAVGDLVLTREENGDFVLNYEIQQSDNAKDWTTYSAQAETITGLPVNKAFVRIRTR